MGVAKLELGIDMGGRSLYCDIPLSPRVILNGNKTIAQTTTGYTIKQTQSGGVDTIEVRDGGNNLVAKLYDSAGPTRIETFTTADGFGVVSAIDAEATGYAYLTRDVSVKSYVISEDHEVIEGMTKEEIEAQIGTISGSVVPVSRGGTGATNAAGARTNLEITPANIGAAAASHNHNASNINAGTLSADRLPTVPITKGGTGATTAANARSNLGITPANIGAAASSHNHAASNITSGTLSADRLPTVPLTKGGTGATNAATARSNLGVKIVQLYSGNFKSGSMTFSLNYDYFIIFGHSGGTYRESVVVPKATLSTSDMYVLLSDELSFFGFKMKYSGSTVTLTFAENKTQEGTTITSGAIVRVYGVNG